MQTQKKNYLVIVAFALPFLLIIGIALVAYAPSWFLKTKYNFVYATCYDNFNYYDCTNHLNSTLRVEDGKLMMSKDTISNEKVSYDVRLFIHDTQNNESREIPVAEAQKINLNGLITSADGVSVEGVFDRNYEFIFFFGGGSSRYGYYLTKGKLSRKLNLINEERYSYYRNNFKFIGWVDPIL